MEVEARVGQLDEEVGSESLMLLQFRGQSIRFALKLADLRRRDAARAGGAWKSGRF